MLLNVVTPLALVSIASAAVVTVKVGDGETFTFQPNNVVAQVGDVVNFQFTGSPGNHTVSQSTFANPCTQLSGGFDSSYVFVPPSFTGQTPQWNLTISNATAPIWYYCKQTTPQPHCIAGMVGSINAPSSGNTIDAFTNAAKALSSFPPQTTGGLSGVGASASSAPGPLTSGSSSSNGTSSSSSGTSPTSTSPAAASSTTGNKPNSAASISGRGLWSLFAAVVGLAIA